jgi:hypothetical protein
MTTPASEQQQQDFGLRRFAVLHHSGGADGPHYDFLFDTSDTSSLVTFRLPEWPLLPGSAHLATKLRDHRRLYLTYEGSISGDRGHVSRVAEGEVRVVRSATGWTLRHLDGRPFLAFEPADPARGDAGDEWRVDAF